MIHLTDQELAHMIKNMILSVPKNDPIQLEQVARIIIKLVRQ